MYPKRIEKKVGGMPFPSRKYFLKMYFFGGEKKYKKHEEYKKR
jgi:hypothetical protein